MTEYYARHFRNGLPIDCGANPHNQACIDRLRGCQDVYGRKRFLVLSQMPDRYLSNAFETGGVMNAAATDIVSPDYRATAFDLLSVSIVVGYCSSAFMAPFFARENILQISGDSMDSREPYQLHLHPVSQQIVHHSDGLDRIDECCSEGTSQIQTFYLNTVVGFDVTDFGNLMLFNGVIAIVSATQSAGEVCQRARRDHYSADRMLLEYIRDCWPWLFR
ncbi:hypothetical protein PC115_g8321 [Phytophthora cactorum]|uniref:Uncharacterized protein n=1 Tax=Phytophthora cactorum TaxID=29920 RepID=A0A8T1CND5_9STRA|nr:hypothetical protein PC115_g8321 [Phytophthora cactorum]